MGDRFDCAALSLLCSENANACFDDLDCGPKDEFGVSHSRNEKIDRTRKQRSECLWGFPLQSEERVMSMVERETEHLPRDDYLKRLRNGDLDLSVRGEALDWMWKAHAHYHFGPVCVCLSMNYLDRFLSIYELPRGKRWTIQLLAVACLSLAAKMEETQVPLSVDLQVGEPKFVFEAKTIQRMELLVLSTLKWRMQSLTPCSFVDYFLSRLNDDKQPSALLISRSAQLILSTIRGINFLEFRPSEIAAAVAISACGEMQALDIDRVMSCLKHVEKARVFKCVQLIKDLLLVSGSSTGASSLAPCVPQSPIGVLDAVCLSYKSDDITVGSCPNSSPSSPENKRRKQEIPSEVKSQVMR